jgi:hypothetical protein
MIKQMAREFILILTAPGIVEAGTMTSNTVKDQKRGQTVLHLRVNITQEKRMAKES